MSLLGTTRKEYVLLNNVAAVVQSKENGAADLILRRGASVPVPCGPARRGTTSTLEKQSS